MNAKSVDIPAGKCNLPHIYPSWLNNGSKRKILGNELPNRCKAIIKARGGPASYQYKYTFLLCGLQSYETCFGILY